LAVKLPRKAVWQRKNMNRPKNPTCEKRRIHTSQRMTGRAGRPDPARLGPEVFLGGEAFAGVVFVFAAGVAVVFAAGVVFAVVFPLGVVFAVEPPANKGTHWSSEGTTPALPVFHGIGSGSSSCVCDPAAT
jgi:anti-sigma factor RsiW